MESVTTFEEPAGVEAVAGVVQLNPATGQMEAMPAEQAAAQRAAQEAAQAAVKAAIAAPVLQAGSGAPRVGAPSVGTPLYRIRFAGQDSTADTFQAVIVLDGMTINIDLMDDAEHDLYEQERKRIADMMIRLGGFSGTGEEAAKISTDIYRAQKALKDTVIKRKVKGFDGLKASEEKRLSLFLPDKVRICDLIQQRSRLGYADTDFSAGS